MTSTAHLATAAPNVLASTDAFRPGDVVRYRPTQRHCCEGMAIANSAGVLYDTYWTSDNHRLRAEEILTVEFLFNLNDCDEIGKYQFPAFEDFAPEDRHIVTSQHGLRTRRFLRKDARPSLLTKITNAEAALDDALAELADAQRRVERAEQALIDLTHVADDA